MIQLRIMVEQEKTIWKNGMYKQNMNKLSKTVRDSQSIARDTKAHITQSEKEKHRIKK